MLFRYKLALRRNYAFATNTLHFDFINVIKMLNEWKNSNDFPLSDELIKLHELFNFFFFLRSHQTENERVREMRMSEQKTLNYESTE